MAMTKGVFPFLSFKDRLVCTMAGSCSISKSAISECFWVQAMWSWYVHMLSCNHARLHQCVYAFVCRAKAFEMRSVRLIQAKVSDSFVLRELSILGICLDTCLDM